MCAQSLDCSLLDKTAQGPLGHQSELAGQTGHLKNEVGHLKEFLLKKKNHQPHAYYSANDQFGWTNLIKSETLIMTGLVWLASSDKWKVPLVCTHGHQDRMQMRQCISWWRRRTSEKTAVVPNHRCIQILYTN